MLCWVTGLLAICLWLLTELVPLCQSVNKFNLYYCIFDCTSKYHLCSSRLTALITRLSPQACDGATFHRANTQPNDPDFDVNKMNTDKSASLSFLLGRFLCDGERLLINNAV